MGSEKYGDIINLPHHVSKTRTRLPMADRAAQFSPFAALTGYEAAVAEAGRLTGERIELDENELEALDRRMSYLIDHRSDGVEISVTHFVADERKDGGEYVSTTGIFKKADFERQKLVLTGGTEISISDIISIESSLFSDFI